MRPLEILTLIILSGVLFALFSNKDRKPFLYLLLAAISSTILLYFVEGLRWQFLPALYLLPCSYIVHRFQKIAMNSFTRGVLLLWFIISVACPWAVPIFKLSKPDGEYDVGTEVFHWIDSTRVEWFTPEDVDDVRELMVQVWYPAINDQKMDPVTYMDHIELRSKTLAQAGKLPSFLPSHLDQIKTNSILGIDFANIKEASPVLIFSHGITGSRHLHQALFEHLASRGYIVVAPDHSYDCNLTIFPNGHIADYRSDITGHPDSVKIRKQQIDTRTKDIHFIIDQVERIQKGSISSKLNGRIDLKRVALGGHSYGGATATVSTHQDKRIKACLVLDSWVSPVPEQIIDSGIHVPFLFMGRPTWDDSDYPGNYTRLDSLMLNSSEPKYQLVIQNTKHLDYTDIPLYSPLIKYFMDIGDLKPSRSIPLINKLVYGFLEKHLSNKGSKIYDQALNNDLVVIQ